MTVTTPKSGTHPQRSSKAVELVPRRIFLSGAGAVGVAFVIPACGGETTPNPEVPAADAPPTDSAGPATPAPEAPTSPEPVASAEPTPAVTANSAWEDQAKTLEAGGQGLYTAKDPKDQPGKQGTHVPTVTLDGNKVKLTTTHPTEAPSAKKPKGHFITHHYLRDGATGLIFAWQEYNLKPGETAAVEFELPAGVTSFTAYQVCNLHWTWVTEAQNKA
jgi:desulfoferrodoxin (superoxide reductase-like protein)